MIATPPTLQYRIWESLHADGAKTRRRLQHQLGVEYPLLYQALTRLQAKGCITVLDELNNDGEQVYQAVADSAPARTPSAALKGHAQHKNKAQAQEMVQKLFSRQSLYDMLSNQQPVA